MSDPNMDLWSSQEIMEYRLEKLSKEVELQRAVIKAARAVIADPLTYDPSSGHHPHESCCYLCDLRDAIRDYDGGDK